MNNIFHSIHSSYITQFEYFLIYIIFFSLMYCAFKNDHILVKVIYISLFQASVFYFFISFNRLVENDPYYQVFMLTAIVVSFSTLAIGSIVSVILMYKYNISTLADINKCIYENKEFSSQK